MVTANLITDNQISDLCANKEVHSVKTIVEYDKLYYRFERSVILKGPQTTGSGKTVLLKFERSVILKGSQTATLTKLDRQVFERSVILKGSQTLLLTPQ